MPQAQNTLDHAGKTYGLRARNGLLFLRALGASQTYAVATPLTPSQENAVAEFPGLAREALENGDIARYAVGYDGYLERTLPLFFRADGTGFCREPWNQDDLPFEHDVSMHEWMEGKDELLAARTDAIGRSSLHAQLAALGEHRGRDLEWICGSLQELQKVATWICHLEAQVWANARCGELQVEVESENEFGRAGVCTWQAQGADKGGWSLLLNAARDEFEVWSQGRVLPTQRFMQLFDLAIDENTPTSLDWEYHDYGAGRCANAPQAETVTLHVARPSAPQIAQARRHLQEWLRGKMTAAEIEAVLADDAPADLPKHRFFGQFTVQDF